MARIRFVPLIREVLDNQGKHQSWVVEEHYIALGNPPLFEPVQQLKCPGCGCFHGLDRKLCPHCEQPSPENHAPTTVWVTTGFRLGPLDWPKPKKEGKADEEETDDDAQ